MNAAMIDQDEWDVVIVGAGPTGLTIANHLGTLGVRTLVLERLDALIDYPRGVGIDDESLRAFQACGLVDAVRVHTVPNQILSFIDKKGRTLAAMSPSAQPFGWPRRNGFIQPRVDRELALGLQRFEHVELRFSSSVEQLHDKGHSVEIDVLDSRAPEYERSYRITAKYLVGCDGGRSLVRNSLGLPFEGQSESTKWLVIDLADDPLGTLNAAFVLDDDLPHVTMGLPHGVRRYEFMVPPDADEATYDTEDTVASLLATVLPHGVVPRVIRHRIYTHHARIAPRFRQGRVLIAGDAAHIMPVWQGQGFNTGIRDAFNLAWKLALAAKHEVGDALLDSYSIERHPHALAMIELSVLTGKIFVPSNRVLKMLRNTLGPLIARIAPLRRYIAEMRFKPMPFFKQGIVCHVGEPRQSGAVGRMFIQPFIGTRGQAPRRLDDVLGLRFAILGWSVDPAQWIDIEARPISDALDACLIKIVPACQASAATLHDDSMLAVDEDGQIKRWFDGQEGPIVILRPDRIVAAVCQPWQLSATLQALSNLMELHPRAGSPLQTDTVSEMSTDGAYA